MERVEVWRPITGYNYFISNLGNVMNSNQKLLRPFSARGYKYIDLWSNRKRFRFTVHHLVMETFTGPCPKGYEVNHINHIRDDNRLENLEYVTRSANLFDKTFCRQYLFTFISELPEGSEPFLQYGSHEFPDDKYFIYKKQIFLKIRDRRFRVLDVRHYKNINCYNLRDKNNNGIIVCLTKL